MVKKCALSSIMYQRTSRALWSANAMYSAYDEPTWYFDAKFVNKQKHTRAIVQKAPGHGHFLEMKNTAYHCPYDFIDNKVNAIYIVYKIRDYDSTGIEHNYLFPCGMSNNHHDVYFLKDEKTMRVLV